MDLLLSNKSDYLSDGLSFSYDHELKIQKARENARRTEKEKEAERYETLMHDYLVR